MAVASAGPYASLHLAPVRLPRQNGEQCQPLSFLQARRPSCHPANSVKALKAVSTEGANYLGMLSATLVN